MIFLVYPHQLFKNIENLKNKKVLLIEEALFFTQFKFHIQKLVLHRATMKFYEEYLKENSIDVEYFEDETYLTKYQNEKVSFYDVADDWLLKKIKTNFNDIKILANPNFFNVNDNNTFLHKYYINRRKEMNLFIEEGKPYGGKWSFDSDNRKKLPKDTSLEKERVFNNKYIQEAKQYCQKFNTFGSCEEFYYPITFNEAKENLEYFLENKFHNFGDYQDSIVKDETFVYHSNISSSLNCGILDLNFVVKKIIDIDVPFNAKEGYLRQIIGWREFMFSVYKSSHISLRTSNFFNFKNKIPKKILEAKSGIVPLDDTIKKLERTAYNHHIERLMILGNLFLLLEIDPNETYEFFMASYIDAYDWVMIANVYAMICFSDGGTFTTKPYLSSSNYIFKMSHDYKKTENWAKIWDGLYWRFLYRNSHRFEKNPRMAMQLALLRKMPQEKLDSHLKNAQEFIDEVF